MIFVAWFGGAVDECTVILLTHLDALPMVNEAPYAITTNPSGYSSSGVKQFGTGSFGGGSSGADHRIDFSGEPGGGVACSNGAMQIEFWYQRTGGTGALSSGNQWATDFYLEFDDGTWAQFIISNAFFVSAPNYRRTLYIAVDSAVSGYDEYRTTDIDFLPDDDFHAIRFAMDGAGAFSMLVDGVIVDSGTLTATIPAGARIVDLAWGDVRTGQLMDEARVKLGGADLAAYTPAATAFLTTACDDVGGVPSDDYYADTILILNCEQSNGSTTFIDTSPIGHTVGTAGGISITDQFAVFDGTDDMLRLTDATEWDFGTGDFTVEVVADLASLPAIWGLITNRSPGISDPDEGFQLVGTSAGLIQATIWGEPSGGAVVLLNLQSASGTATTGLHNFCLQRSGSDFVLAYDGASVATGTSSAAMGYNSGFDVQIGNDESAAGRYFHGDMRVRVTKGVARYSSFPYTPDSSPWPDPA